MEQQLFFYSKDGTDSHGPVTEEELRALIVDKVIGSDSYFCREGETEWRPLDPDVFVRPPGTTRLPPYEPPPYVPPPDARERDSERVAQLQEGWEEPGPYPALFTLICWLLAIAATVVLQKVVRHNDDGFIGYVGVICIVGALPYFISRLFKPAWRRRACLLVMVLFIAFVFFGQQKIDSLSATTDATTPAPPTADAPATPPSGGS